jgi:hypothetical protein
VLEARGRERNAAGARRAARHPWRRCAARAVAEEIRAIVRVARESDWPKDLRALSFARESLHARNVCAARALATEISMQDHTHKRLVDYADCAG